MHNKFYSIHWLKKKKKKKKKKKTDVFNPLLPSPNPPPSPPQHTSIYSKNGCNYAEIGRVEKLEADL